MKETYELQTVAPIGWISSGSSLLNTLISGDKTKGYPLGYMVNLIGPSGSGKSLLAMDIITSFQEFGVINEKTGKPFEHMKCLYIDAENGMQVDYAKRLGVDFDKLDIISTSQKKDADGFKGILTIEEAIDFISRYTKFEEGETTSNACRVVILDSLDGLPTNTGVDRVENGDLKNGKGSFGDGKAKVISENLPKLIQMMHQTNTFILIISHEKFTIGDLHPQKARAGGKTLKFLASVEAWINGVKKLVSDDTKLQYGWEFNIEAGKNRFTPAGRKIKLTCHGAHGLDDVTTLVNFLRDNKDHVNTFENLQKIQLPSMEKGMRVSDFIKVCNSDGENSDAYYRELVQVSEEIWKIREEKTYKSAPKRKRLNMRDL